MFTFVTSYPCHLDLESSEAKINWGQVLTKTNQRVKYDSSVTSSSQENEQKLFLTEKPYDLDPGPSEPKN